MFNELLSVKKFAKIREISIYVLLIFAKINIARFNSTLTKIRHVFQVTPVLCCAPTMFRFLTYIAFLFTERQGEDASTCEMKLLEMTEFSLNVALMVPYVI